MLKGFNTLFVTLGLYTAECGGYQIINAAGDALFTFLPLFLGYTAAKKFQLKPMLGLAVGVAMCYPGIQLSALSGAGEPLLYLLEGTMFQSPVYIDFFGIPIFLWIIQERSFRSFWQSGLPPGVKSCLTGLCRIW